MPIKRNNKIGVFDSGFGGLSVLKHIVKILPEYDYLYFGDTARTPYGTRSQKRIYEFTTECLEYMFKEGCSLVILACNTASSEALRKIQKEFLPKYFPDKKVLGVIIPASEYAVSLGSKKIGVLATEATVRSGSFSKEVQKLSSGKSKVFQIACPLLVPMIENGEEKGNILKMILEKYLAKFKIDNLEAIILGCTHYELIEKEIKKLLPSKVKIVSEGKVVALKLKDYLYRHHEIKADLSKKGKRIFLTTDSKESFNKHGGRFFGKKIHAKSIKL